MAYLRIEELDVYKIAESLADKLWNICIQWDSFAKHTIGRQLVTAADSVGANLAEGHGRYSTKENIQFCYYARGSLDETRNWVRRALNRHLMNEQQSHEITTMIEELGPRLNAYINSIKHRSSIK